MNRTQLKRQYKEEVKAIQNNLITLLTPDKDNARDEDKEITKANVKALQEDLKEAKDKLKMFLMNKTGSSFFEWHPHIGPNRRMRKQFKQYLNKR